MSGWLVGLAIVGELLLLATAPPGRRVRCTIQGGALVLFVVAPGVATGAAWLFAWLFAPAGSSGRAER